MKKTYSKPQLFMESFAITEHFASAGSGCDAPVSSADACDDLFNFGPNMQGFYEYMGCSLPFNPDNPDEACYHGPVGDMTGAVYS